MTLRHAVLTASGLAVLGLGIYLFLEVRAAPATAAEVASKRPTAARTEQSIPEPPSEEKPEGTSSGRREARTVQAPVRDVTHASSDAPPPQVPSDPEEAKRVNVEKDAIMAEANKAYDRGDFAEAQAVAERVLKEDPTNVRMLRIMVSSACIEGDSVVAQTHYLKLPPTDREQMRTRCGRYGVSFNEQ
ncbi:MAG: hypothetical protein SFX73_09160 [Kofleriaceae bacterium]|nr:hypothetical protein [Kofleriaceae bacterium]